MTLDEIYASLPGLDCQGLCEKSCGPTAMSSVEWRRIRKRLGFAPSARKDLRCPLLRDGRCRVYDIRPLICRLWGLVETMPCTFGCQPRRWLKHDEGHKLLQQASVLAGDVKEAAV